MSFPLIFIVGPTAIGKSEFAIKLAKYLKGEIINADSMQVYSELNILTARPSNQDHKIVPHHLYGHINGEVLYFDLELKVLLLIYSIQNILAYYLH